MTFKKGYDEKGRDKDYVEEECDKKSMMDEQMIKKRKGFKSTVKRSTMKERSKKYK